MDRTKSGYASPNLTKLAFDCGEDAPLDPTQTQILLSAKDVLALVQAAFDELAADGLDLRDAKREIFERVAKAELAQALRSAILAAGRVGGTR